MPITKITSDRNQANLPQNLERYCQYALKLGADEARVVAASKIPVLDAVAFRSILEIVSKLESAAFYDGHYLAVGFSAGSCYSSVCDPNLGCKVVKAETCRFPLKARPSMEAVGMDVYSLIASFGYMKMISHKTDQIKKSKNHAFGQFLFNLVYYNFVHL